MTKLTTALWIAAPIALGLLLGTITRQRHELALQGLQLTSSKAAEQRASAEAATLRDALATANARAKRNDLAQAELRAHLQRVESRLGARFTLIEGRLNETAESRAWADAPLPAAAARLRQRPALVGAAAYRDWLSSGGAVPPAGQPADEERPPAD